MAKSWHIFFSSGTPWVRRDQARSAGQEAFDLFVQLADLRGQAAALLVQSHVSIKSKNQARKVVFGCFWEGRKSGMSRYQIWWFLKIGNTWEYPPIAILNRFQSIEDIPFSDKVLLWDAMGCNGIEWEEDEDILGLNGIYSSRIYSNYWEYHGNIMGISWEYHGILGGIIGI